MLLGVFGNLGDQAKATTSAFEIFGSRQRQMINVAVTHGDAIRDLIEEHKRYGIVTTQEAKKMENLSESWTRLTNSVDTFSTKTLARMVGAADQTNNVIDDLALKFGSWSNNMNKSIENMKKIGYVIGTILIPLVVKLGIWFGRLIGPWGLIAAGIASAYAAIKPFANAVDWVAARVNAAAKEVISALNELWGETKEKKDIVIDIPIPNKQAISNELSGISEVVDTEFNKIDDRIEKSRAILAKWRVRDDLRSIVESDRRGIENQLSFLNRGSGFTGEQAQRISSTIRESDQAVFRFFDKERAKETIENLGVFQKQYYEALKNLEKPLIDWKQIAENSMSGFSQAVSDAIGSAIRDFKSLEDTLRNFAADLVQRIAPRILEGLLVSGLSSAFGINLSGGSGGLQLPRFASGGEYRGGAAIVGESGPEVFASKSPGHIYSNQESRRMMGNNYVINFAPVINSNDPLAVRQAVLEVYPEWEARTQKMIIEAQQIPSAMNTGGF